MRLSCPPSTSNINPVMNKTTTYTIQELLNKYPANKELKTLDWTKDKDDLEFDLSSIIGGDWMVDRHNNTVTNLY